MTVSVNIERIVLQRSALTRADARRLKARVTDELRQVLGRQAWDTTRARTVTRVRPPTSGPRLGDTEELGRSVAEAIAHALREEQ